MTRFIRPRLKDTEAAEIVCRTIVERAAEAWSFLARDLLKSATRAVALPNSETAIKALIAAAFSSEFGNVNDSFLPARAHRFITITEQTLNLGDPARTVEREIFSEARRYSQEAKRALSQGDNPQVAVSVLLLTDWFDHSIDAFQLPSDCATDTINLDEGFILGINMVIWSLTGQWTRIASEYRLLNGGPPVAEAPQFDLRACNGMTPSMTEVIQPVHLQSALELATSLAIPGDLFFVKTAQLYTYSLLGVLLDGDTVAIASWRRTRLVPLSRVKLPKNAVICRAPDAFVQQEISRYARTHHSDWRRFRLALAGLVMGNLEAMRTDQWPTPPRYSSQAEFDAAWDRLEETLECGDLIMTFDPGSLLCRAIALLDSGPWSHGALHLDHGVLAEADTPGVGLCNIRRYRQPGIHVGVYRQLIPRTQAERRKIMMMARDLGKKYNWRGALQAGLNAFFNVQVFSYRTSDGSVLLQRTPNQGLYEGRVYLVAHA